MSDAPEPQEGPTVTVRSKHTERLKDLRQFIIGWRELDWPEGFDRFTAQTIADEVEKRFPKNDAPDLAPAPLPAPDHRLGYWCGLVRGKPFEIFLKATSTTNPSYEGRFRQPDQWVYLGPLPDTQERSNDSTD